MHRTKVIMSLWLTLNLVGPMLWADDGAESSHAEDASDKDSDKAKAKSAKISPQEKLNAIADEFAVNADVPERQNLLRWKADVAVLLADEESKDPQLQDGTLIAQLLDLQRKLTLAGTPPANLPVAMAEPESNRPISIVSDSSEEILLVPNHLKKFGETSPSPSREKKPALERAILSNNGPTSIPAAIAPPVASSVGATVAAETIQPARPQTWTMNAEPKPASPATLDTSFFNSNPVAKNERGVNQPAIAPASMKPQNDSTSNGEISWRRSTSVERPIAPVSEAPKVSANLITPEAFVAFRNEVPMELPPIRNFEPSDVSRPVGAVLGPMAALEDSVRREPAEASILDEFSSVESKERVEREKPVRDRVAKLRGAKPLPSKTKNDFEKMLSFAGGIIQ